jgi:ABC-type lipoprotein export system ATPase subunit
MPNPEDKLGHQAPSSRTGQEYKVLRVSTKGNHKRVLIDSTAGPQEVMLHRFALVGPGDRIRIREGLERRVWVVGAEGESADIPVSPSFEAQRPIVFAGEETQLRILEPTTSQLLNDHAELEAFHYRGLDFSEEGQKTKKGVGGRRAVLIAQIRINGAWETAGFIELQMPLLMAKPRHVAFDRPFSHPSGIKWNSWRKGGQENINRLVRIARTVVHPEYRGAKLSASLVRAAKDFSCERWHIGGRKPLFLEISAEMLRHIDFVSGCGFHYLGETEGNRKRVAKDLDSIRKGAKGASGIMSVQRKYFAAFERYRSVTNESFESLQARISELLRLPDPFSAMTKDEWLAFKPIIRSPIPYYVLGLDAVADSFVKEASLPRPVRFPRPARRKLDQIVLRGVELWSNYEIPPTDANRLILTSFGITTDRLVQRMMGAVNLEIQAGSVTFVGGASGCGKSLFLANLDPSWSSPTVETVGSINPESYRVGWLRPFPADAPLFGYLAEMHGAERTFDALARVGLSEALLFLKPFEMLSRGQRYRAMLANLLLGDDDVWLIDEFCSDLDPLSARIVAGRLRETVREENRIAVVAAANNGHFIQALRPQRVLLLKTGREAVLGTWKEYVDGLLR